jgi:molybdopterin converting factor subunit 1
MRIYVKLFAILRERAGTSEVHLDLPQSATVADAAEALLQRHPALRDATKSTAYAVNCEYAPTSAVLADGDELALIPPVSGGRS